MFAAAFAFLRIDTDEMVGGGDVYPVPLCGVAQGGRCAAG